MASTRLRLGTDQIDESARMPASTRGQRETRSATTSPRRRRPWLPRAGFGILTEHEHLGPETTGNRSATSRRHRSRHRSAPQAGRCPLPGGVDPEDQSRNVRRRGGCQRSAVNDLPTAAESAERFTVLGAGKTAVDACTWLLDHGVSPDRIRWIRPRDMWFHHRRHFQPLELVGENMEGVSLDAEAGANATDLEDLFARLESAGRLRASIRSPGRRCTAARCSAPTSSMRYARSKTL